jgi:S1-C subfamily serine protease
MLVGDVLLALGEKPVRSPEDLLDRLVETPAGTQTVLRVLRGGTPVELAVTVGERPQ